MAKSMNIYINQFMMFVALLIFSAGCGGGYHFQKYQPLPSDMRPISLPEESEINIMKDAFDKIVKDQIKQSFDVSRQMRNISGERKRAMNADPFGEVANSSWFTNRNDLKKLSLDEIAHGPDQRDKPITTGTWTIVRAKVEGVTPGFTIKDDRSLLWVIKFEPKKYPELNTGAEVVSTKLFHAAGYNVPENYIVRFDPRILKIGEKVNITDAKGRKRPMTEDDLMQTFEKIEKLPDGRIRAIASKLLPGAIGPFRYIGTRKDDPNDIIPHEHRRELRGLRIIAAWLNHFDTKANNSLDIFHPEKKYVLHYLIDYGSTLGSNGDEPMPAEIGHENSFDPHQFFANIATLGLYVKKWEKTGEVKYPSIGYFESSLFKSHKYKFITPNPAFELMTDEDAFWGAKIVMSFTDEQLKTAVDQGEYSNPEAAAYLLQVIKERRDITGRYWFGKMSPVDHFELKHTSDEGLSLHFRDLAIESNLASAESTTYRCHIRRDGKTITPWTEIGSQNNLHIPASDVQAGKEVIYEIAISARRDGKEWIRPVMVYARAAEGQGLKLRGVSRE